MSLYQTAWERLYYYRSRLIRRLLLKARDPEALAFDFSEPSPQFRGQTAVFSPELILDEVRRDY